jgi:predicted component of type VI protein secretion system
MHKLSLDWVEEGQNHSKAFSSDQIAERPVRIGRDQSQCDVALKDNTRTVSKLHVEIFFDSQSHRFYLRNLTRDRERPNPAWVDGQKIIEQEIPLKPPGANIQLGKVSLRVKILLPAGSKPIYGLKCHVCGKISPREDLSIVCRWCGTSLAAAETAVYFPDE